ncbi:hypothetical protein Leryth_020112 [Lithospermum erythrorhizon]|nr:hypothetical protein Leryth_020112 [Lithospermum erythrorhizon]
MDCGQVRLSHNKIKNLKARHEIANEIQEIHKRIVNISEAHKRYHTQYAGVAAPTGSSSSVMPSILYDRRGDALLLEEADLVGTEKPRNELKNCKCNVISNLWYGRIGENHLGQKVFDGSIKYQKLSSTMHMDHCLEGDLFKLRGLLKGVKAL